MLQDPDHTVAISHAPTPAPADDTPFAYGEGTVMRLQTQSFDVEADDLGTMMAKPATPMVVAATEIAVAAAAPPLEILAATAESEDDPLARMERKLDLALRQIERLQQRIESLDLTLARTILR